MSASFATRSARFLLATLSIFRYLQKYGWVSSFFVVSDPHTHEEDSLLPTLLILPRLLCPSHYTVPEPPHEHTVSSTPLFSSPCKIFRTKWVNLLGYST